MTTQRIAELEAEIVRLRDLIFDIAGEEPSFSWRKANETLSTPIHPPIALHELIEKVEERTIARCAKEAFDFWADQIDCSTESSATAIRSLSVGQIKLEELL